jgi:radical SAM-linked protein
MSIGPLLGETGPPRISDAAPPPSRSLPRMPGRRVPEGPAPAPVVQRLRLRYAKRGRLRFSSTRDFQRALERALRRADVPMAFSAGFHPHPRISYANAAPTGTASEAEYVELAVSERVDPEAVRVALDEALPVGIDVLEVVEAAAGSLADRLEASEWAIAISGLDEEVLREAVATYLAVDRAEVSRTFKTGPRTFDTRAAVLDMRVVDPATVTDTVPQAVPAGAQGCAIIRMVVRHTTPAVRPDDILTALRAVAGLVPPAPPLVTRLAQGPLVHDVAAVADPLAPDEKVGGS